jgi:predicted Zn-dependent peptidase
MTTNKKIPLQRELDFNYTAFVLGKTNNANADVRRKWLLYDNILEELVKEEKDKLIDEIKYRITDNEDDKKVFKSVLKKIKFKSTRLNLLINSI